MVCFSLAEASLEIVIGSMTKYKKHAGVQRSAAAALGNFAKIVGQDELPIHWKTSLRYQRVGETCKKVADSGAIALLTDALQNHVSNPDVIERVCWTLSHLSFLHDNKDEIGAGGIIKLILLAMERHHSHTAILMYTSNTLANLARSHAVNAVAIVEAGGIKHVLEYLDMHLTQAHPGILETATSALFAIANAPGGGEIRDIASPLEEKDTNPPYIVKRIFGLPLSMSDYDFYSPDQQEFKDSLAAAVGVPSVHVSIERVHATIGFGQQLAAKSIRVETSIKVASLQQAIRCRWHCWAVYIL